MNSLDQNNQEAKIRTKTSLKTNSLVSSKGTSFPFRIEKKQGYQQTAHKTQNCWKTKETIKYLVFVFFATEIMTDLQEKNRWAAFKVMSSFIETKNANQCRIYHKKMMKEYNDVHQLLSKVKDQVPHFSQIAFTEIKQLTLKIQEKDQKEESDFFLNKVKEEVSSNGLRLNSIDREIVEEKSLIADSHSNINYVFPEEKEVKQQNIKTDVTIKEKECLPLQVRSSIKGNVFQNENENQDFFQNLNQQNGSFPLNPFWPGMMRSSHSLPFYDPYHPFNAREPTPYQTFLPQSIDQEWRQCHQLFLAWRSKFSSIIEKLQK